MKRIPAYVPHCQVREFPSFSCLAGVRAQFSEVIHRRDPWRSFEAVEYATLEWADWFNNRRLLEPIGNIPPAEAEAIFYAALETEDRAA